VSTIRRRPSPLTAFAIRRSRVLWHRRFEDWDRDGSPGLATVVERVLDECGDLPGAVVADLGSGSGQLSLPLAAKSTHVLAVDINPLALALLAEKANHEGLANIQPVERALETVDLPPESVDLVVSNYALHHLRDVDKRLLIARSFAWLRPGGRLVIGDMMFGRGADRTERELILAKVRALARRGPGGWWRIVKNGWRFMLRFEERPLRSSDWESIVREAGFAEVSTQRVVAEACVLSATKPR
jgi:SAM-dependent methyltransferase